jgi:acetate---CoA ligase (ADP-forming)
VTEAHTYDHALPDGTTVHIRPIHDEDGPLLLRMWERLSQETIRSRFLGSFDLTERNVHRFTDVDPDDAFALVATLGRGDAERIVAVGRYERLRDHEEAEFALLVEDAHQGRGIGTALLR